MRNKTIGYLRLSLLLVVLILVAGCSDGKPKRVPVAGTVLIDGKPVTLGSIQFVPQGARASGSAIDSNGRFKLTCYEPGDGAIIGTHRVRVTAAKNISEREVRWEAPKVYSEIATSGLSVDVDGPTDDVVINLKWNGGTPFIERQ